MEIITLGIPHSTPTRLTWRRQVPISATEYLHTQINIFKPYSLDSSFINPRFNLNSLHDTMITVHIFKSPPESENL